MPDASIDASQKSPYLRIRDVEKKFGAFHALKRVSLDVFPGEFVCFLGPSGCGKTTLLRAIAGLDPQNGGTIQQGGRDISQLPPSQRDFGIVFQSYALFPNLSVADNVGYGLVSQKLDKAQLRTRVAELIDLVGLKGHESKYPAQISGGQAQRVALARAIAMSPGLLLLDEPLSALDARVRLHLRGELKDLQRRLGITTIMVTHDQEEALAIADRIVVMNEGRIEQIGTPEEIYRRPASAFVATFVGQMNFLPGRVDANGLVAIGPVTLHVDVSGVGAAPGSEVLICLRPEDVQVRGIAADGVNRLHFQITSLEFFGAFCRAGLALDGGRELTLAADFSVNAVRDLSLNTGMTLPVTLPPQHLRVFQRADAKHG